MNGTEDLNAKQDTLNALDKNAILKPNIPIQNYLQEAEYLHIEALKDKTALINGANLAWQLVDDLLQRIGALREAEALWFKNRFNREAAQRQWDEQAPQAYALRDELLRAFRYAFSEEEDLSRRVVEIAAGRGHDDMIQDLSRLVAIGRDYPDQLSAINYPLTKLEIAANLSDEMGTLLAQAAGERSDTSTDLELRNRAYTHLKQAIDKIRGAGQYVFWDNNDRRKHYASQYHRATRSKSAPTAAPTPSQL